MEKSFLMLNPIFSYKSESSWQAHDIVGYQLEIGYNEDYLEDEENEYGQYIVVQSPIYNEKYKDSIEYRLSILHEKEIPNVIQETIDPVVTNITKEQFNEIEKAIETQDGLIEVNTHIDCSLTRVCDGSDVTYYFCCDKFNREVNAYCLESTARIDSSRYEEISERDLKAINQCRIVNNAAKVVFDLLNKFGIKIVDFKSKGE